MDEQIRGVGQPTDRTLLFDSPKVPKDPIVTALIEHGADTKNVPADLDEAVKLSVQRAASRTTVQSILQRRPLRSCSGFLTPLLAARLRLEFTKSVHNRLASDSIVALCLYEDELVRLIAEKIVAKRTSHVFREDAAQALVMQQRELGLRGEPMLPGTRLSVDGETGVVREQTESEGESSELAPNRSRVIEGQRVCFGMNSVRIVSLDAGTRDPKTWDVLPAVVFDASEAQARAVSSHELSRKYQYYMNVE
jgi:hypothetical protein